MDTTKVRPRDSSEEASRSPEEQRPLQLATEGAGPLLQRDYVLVLEGSACTPEEAVLRIRTDFPELSPPELAAFSRPDGATGPLSLGDTMHIHIRGAGDCAVQVTHQDAHSMTLRTLEGHQEAGRITFGAYRDAGGRLVCRIRSRARQKNAPRYVGYALLGKHAQTMVWVTFLKRLADRCGGRKLGEVNLATGMVPDSKFDAGSGEAPTFDTR